MNNTQQNGYFERMRAVAPILEDDGWVVPPMTPDARSALLAAPADPGRMISEKAQSDDFYDKSQRADAMSAVLDWVNGEDHSYAELYAIVTDGADVDEETGEITDPDEQEVYDQVLDQVADAIRILGSGNIDNDMIDAVLVEGDDKVAEKVAAKINELLKKENLSDDDIIGKFAMSGAITESTSVGIMPYGWKSGVREADEGGGKDKRRTHTGREYPAIRNGERVKLYRRPGKPEKRSQAQKAQTKIMQPKSKTPKAIKKWKRSMGMRAKLGLGGKSEAPGFAK